jgi:GDP-4-dehydro-6-deoxy-D-mannose reductase
LLREFQPNWIFHLASGLRDDPPRELLKTNVDGSMALTQAIVDSERRPQLVVYASSGAVYGHPRRLPLDEADATQPVDVYGATKLQAEQMTRMLTRQYSVSAVWARLFNLVGPGQDERHVCGYFASRTAAIVAGDSAREISVGPLEATRDFIDVRDAARALILLARFGTDGTTYNIASGREVAVADVLSRTLQLARLEGQVLIHRDPTQRARIPRHYGDIRRLCALGFAPKFELAHSLSELFDYYRSAVHCEVGPGVAAPTAT